AEAVLAGIDRPRREATMALLLVEQHARVAREMAEPALVPDRGRVAFAGPSRHLADPAALARAMGMAPAG
ncbi:MAG: hypothetical protein ACP5NP_03705, partial [Acetobacteraceae bacterium]